MPANPRLNAKIAAPELALKATLVAVCISIAFGGALRSLATSVVPSLGLMIAQPLQTQLPAEEPPLQEELPTEAPSPGELPKSEESLSFAAEQKQARRIREQSRASSVRTRSSRVLLIATTSAASSFEYRLRNGCGAHLRC